MAVENKKTTELTNLDGVPFARNHVAANGGRVRRAGGTLAVAAGDDDGSIFRFARLPSNAVMVAIWLFNDAIATGTSYHCGLYRTAKDGGAAVDNDVFATAVDMTTARTTAPINLLFEALDIINVNKQLWEILGLAADPQVEYDLALTGATVGSGAGDISLIVEYCID
ncbi:MAG TPA: hypothetical protein VFS41_05100 [Edaphobacter sp.]|nr:hypothetical protein [Edaphobacter sp.]